MTNRYSIIKLLVCTLLAFSSWLSVSAFDPNIYAGESILSRGGVLKVAVEQDGVYLVTNNVLKSYGFSDPSRVRVYGYACRRINDVLSLSNYVDDLPPAASVVTDRGIVFYGEGPGKWTHSAEGRYYYTQNDYSRYSYYYLAELPEGAEDPVIGSVADPDEAVGEPSVYLAHVQHELELVSPGEAGTMLVGEEFRYTSSRTLNISTPGALAGSGNAYLRCSFISNMETSGSSLNFTVNGHRLPAVSTDKLPATSSSHYVHGTETITENEFEAPGTETMQVTVGVDKTSKCRSAWLNYLTVNYPARAVVPAAGWMVFSHFSSATTIGGAGNNVTVWDVTDPANVAAVKYARSGNNVAWSYGRQRRPRTYAVWNSDASLPSPQVVGKVPAQNLHAQESVNLVIVAPAAFTEQAERLAQFHRNSEDSLTVTVVDPEAVYNEFSSGVPDPGALRRYFKMLYDRGLEGQGSPLRYAIMLARTTYDMRRLTSAAPDYPVIPSWMPGSSRASLSDNEGYSSDDICAMLDDGSGSDLYRDKLSISVGRMPATSVTEARNIVDKTLQYAEQSRKSAWRHRFLFLADDRDNGVHVLQTESLIKALERTDNQQNFVRKVYIDAYEHKNNGIPAARELMFRYLDEGVVWWNFVGHANPTSWTAENILMYTDLSRMYLRHWPFIYAATCNFLRLDASSMSGAEMMYKERYGGAIGVISAVRPVYIFDNGQLSDAIGRALAKRDESGRFYTPGEIYRTAKNDIRKANGTLAADDNRLRYIFIGDPALRLAMPSNIVRLDKIGDAPVDPENPPVIAALQHTELSGSVVDPQGNIIEDFEGVILIDIFDAERTTTTLGYGDDGVQLNYEEYGDRVYTGSAVVKGGRFTMPVAMPSELTQNFRPATMSLYAYDTRNDADAVGLCRDFYVYGVDESAAPDLEPPMIESFVLNHSSFRSGDKVNDSPMLIATVSDNVGINVSNAGIGHQMTAIIDGINSFNDLSFFFTPSSEREGAGVINYPFEGLQPGKHTLQLRVWDTSGNSETATLDFEVAQNIAPKIYEVYTDANPASTQANFYLLHDQPDAMATVVVTVYNLVGQPVWSGGASGRSDMFTTIPVTWDLTDRAGRRVNRGIYIYRAQITTDGQTYETASRRIAVTAQ